MSNEDRKRITQNMIISFANIQGYCLTVFKRLLHLIFFAAWVEKGESGESVVFCFEDRLFFFCLKLQESQRFYSQIHNKFIFGLGSEKASSTFSDFCHASNTTKRKFRIPPEAP